MQDLVGFTVRDQPGIVGDANPGVIFAAIQESIDMPVMILLVINTGYLLRGGVGRL